MLVQTYDNSKYIYFKKGEVLSAVQASGLGNKEETTEMILECIKTKKTVSHCLVHFLLQSVTIIKWAYARFIFYFVLVP